MPMYHCNTCKKDVYPKTYHSQMNIVFLDFVLLLFFVVPLIIFYLATMNKKVCPSCGSSNLYPLSESENGKPKIKKYKIPKWLLILVGLIIVILAVNFAIDIVLERKKNADFTAKYGVPYTKPVEVIEKTPFKIIEEKDISYAGCRRIAIKIVVPNESDKILVENTLGYIVDKYKSSWDDVTVWAYRYSEEEQAIKMPFTMGMKEGSTCR